MAQTTSGAASLTSLIMLAPNEDLLFFGFERAHFTRNCLVSRRSSPLCASSIRTDDDTVLYIQVLADPSQRARLCVEVVYGNIEETLDLTGVKIHSDYMVASGSLKHVGHQFGRDGCTRLVLLVLTSVGEVRQNSSDTACRRSLASVDHDQELHESVVDVARWGRLQDEDCRTMSYSRSS